MTMRPVCKGATPFRDGCTFVVWAPHADDVSVVGSFNEWSKDAHPLAKQTNGFWSVDVPDTKPGDEYRFCIVTGDKEFLRIDPYARQVTS
jgi:1,4-alpha-glucan branching enzyme